ALARKNLQIIFQVMVLVSTKPSTLKDAGNLTMVWIMLVRYIKQNFFNNCRLILNLIYMAPDLKTKYLLKIELFGFISALIRKQFPICSKDHSGLYGTQTLIL
ncbi:hypothetical protein AAULR_26756, partial [Lacticaseibacillus rhamnosus MTCC 5462]